MRLESSPSPVGESAMQCTNSRSWVKVSFWDFSCVIFGRMIEASDEAEVEDDPGTECSARMVVR